MKKKHILPQGWKKIWALCLILCISFTNVSVVEVAAQTAKQLRYATGDITDTEVKEDSALAGQAGNDTNEATNEDEGVIGQGAVTVAMATNEKPVLSEPAKTKPAVEQEIDPIPQPAKTPAAAQASEPRVEKESGSNTLLYAGLGIGAAVAIGVGLSGGGGSDPAPVVTPDPEPVVEPVGADLAGTNWSGVLVLGKKKTKVKENITATITQNGTEIEITTSSTQEYAKHFKGKIDKKGEILAYDQTTGEDWTTYEKAAKWNSVDLFDKVDNLTDLDEMYLSRSSK